MKLVSTLSCLENMLIKIIEQKFILLWNLINKKTNKHRNIKL